MDKKRFKYRTIRSEAGAGTLALLFSTFGGAVFLLTFYNLAQYTAARSAADQAVRRAVRCLSPSDPECKQTTTSAPNTGTTPTWFGYQPSNGPTSVAMQTYKYDGRVSTSDYGANYNTYEVQTANPIVGYSEASVKPVRLVGLMNSFTTLKADITRRVYKYQNNNGQRILKDCRLKEAVELPSGMENVVEETYSDERWCNGIGIQELTKAPGCEDVGNGDYLIISVAPAKLSCQLEFPKPIDSEIKWTLLGGDPVCDNEPTAPTLSLPGDEDQNRIPSSVEETNLAFRNKGIPDSAPGVKGRPHIITNPRQFLIIEGFPCDGDDYLARARNSIKTSDDIKKFFNTDDKIPIPKYANNPTGDFLAAVNKNNNFLYNSGPESNFISKEEWTYTDWTREREGTPDKRRYLYRKVCEWLPWDEAVKKWPELANPANGSKYQAGRDNFNPPKEIKLSKAPACLKPTNEDKDFICGQRTVVGQAGAIPSCAGWTEKKKSLEIEYASNTESAVSKNKHKTNKNLTTFDNEFISKIDDEVFRPGVSGASWEPSWSKSNYYGTAIINPTAVRDYGGSNPKELSNNNLVKNFDKKNENDQTLTSIKQKVINSIISEAGFSNANGYDELVASTQLIKKNSYMLPLTGAFPFIKDSSGESLPQGRPYLQSTGGGYDYDLDCKPDASCQGPSFSSLDEALRHYGSSAPEVKEEIDLKDPNYIFEYSEVPDQVKLMSKAEASTMPACSEFITTCGTGGVGTPILLGQFNTMPPDCTNGNYASCYPVYASGQLPIQEYTSTTNTIMAKDKALGEIRRLMPGATFCNSSSGNNCVDVNIQQVGQEVSVDVTFNAPLTTPFKEILGSDTLAIKSSKSEMIETERLKGSLPSN